MREDTSLEKSLEKRICQKLEAAFHPFALEVVNESHKHQGHAGYGKESHFHLTIGSEVFLGKTTVACHRLIFQALQHEMDDGKGGMIHALSIQLIRGDPGCHPTPF
jgi:BolA protein